jgi:hypothetical protein
MGGTLGAKSFPWPTAIGNSPNVTPLVASQAPSINGPNNSLTPGSPSPTTGGSPTMSMPNSPSAPSLPVGQPTRFKPISRPVSLPQSNPFYA